ncbi:LysR family transcriptional regulator [Micromonospora sp. R77]|uniref:LysR family transcriptional regulator n=1 Tax=Micromonospora sp. R77 TaxID=2925836 RepID=UPI001F60B855|nr:LysR family transcriptional regulator [Micromonospora sp. R77]MCI4061429.1 LysR family transcriptional regulator [Micromonospora sp. R77]
MQVEVRHLRAVSAIAEVGSISRASVRLGISQPALTTQLRRIEEALGTRLFVRSRSGVVPTDAGRQLLSRARVVLGELDAILENLPVSAPSRELLRMGAVHVAASSSLVRCVEEAMPGTAVGLRIEPSSRTLLDLTARGLLDVGLVSFVEGFVPQLPEGLMDRILLPRYPIFVAMSAGHSLAGRESVRLADLRQEFWVRPPGADDGSLAALRHACRKEGFEPLLRYDAPSGAAWPLVAQGRCVRLVDPSWPAAPGTVTLPLADEAQMARLSLVWQRVTFSSREASTLVDAVTRAIAAHAQDNPGFHRWWQSSLSAQPR